eukprot:symbB.v1.2.020166.t1/scaffold1649.1/size108312/9
MCAHLSSHRKGCLVLEQERMEAAKKLFQLTDLNGDGLITPEEFALMGLNQTKAHAEKKLTQHDEQGIKGIFIQKFSKEIDSSLKPVPFPEYKEYILRSVNNMDPGDKEAREGRCFGLSSDARCDVRKVSPLSALMGNIPFCDCADVCRDTNHEVNVFEQERMEAAKKLFQLTDLNGDGLITPEEFALMGLNQTKAHAEKKLTQHDEQGIKGIFIQKFSKEIDSSLKPAQSMILDGLLVEATLAREMVEEDKGLLSAEAVSLPTLLMNFDKSQPLHKSLSGNIVKVSPLSALMGNIPFCDCSDVCRDTNHEVNVFEQDRMEAAKKLFQLTDLNGDGLITPEEFALMGLNQTKAHAEKKLTQHDEQGIKGIFIQKFSKEIDSSLRPAQSMILDGLLVEATLAREMVEEDKGLLSAEAVSLPTLLMNFDKSQPLHKSLSGNIVKAVESTGEFCFDRCVDVNGSTILQLKHVIRSPAHSECPIKTEAVEDPALMGA